MKFIKLVSIAVVLIALAGTGCSDKKLSSGTYTMSKITFTEDECNLQEDFAEGAEILLTIKDKAIMISFSEEKTPPTGTITDNSFTALASKKSDTIPDTNCEDNWSKKMTGTFTQKNVFRGTYEFIDETVQGTDCLDVDKIGFPPPRCTSFMTFTATRKPGS
jgi:hypothetical protein